MMSDLSNKPVSQILSQPMDQYWDDPKEEDPALVRKMLGRKKKRFLQRVHNL